MKHPYHLVDPRPWPFTGAVGSILFVTGIIRTIHLGTNPLITLGVLLLSATMIQWWRDVSREATLQGKHTDKVENGLRLGMLLFIMSEVLFFFSFFWAFFHSSLSPNVELGTNWPPSGLKPIRAFEVPLLNTVLLLSRGVTVTWVHIAILCSEFWQTQLAFLGTVLLGLLFSLLQIMEYRFSSFTVADSVFGCTFYIATGFHGLHVLIGTLFLVTIWARSWYGHFRNGHHFGFEARAWYWHFVDVVWLFLFVSIYWWGS